MSKLRRNPAGAAWLIVAALAAFMLAFAGCGGDDDGDDGGEALQEVGKGEGELDLIAWLGYVEDGSTDPKVDWVSDFEKQTGCQIERQGLRHLRRDGRPDADR